MNIDDTLKERGSRYGAFTGHARITYNLKRALQDSPKWHHLADDQREALDMIVHKIGRILNGDPNYSDSWQDIVGYAKLVADRLVSLEARLKDAKQEPPLQATPPPQQGYPGGCYTRPIFCPDCGCIHAEGKCQISTRQQTGWNIHAKDMGL